MEKTIHIDGKAVPLKASASTLRRYRAVFNRDLLDDFNTLRNAINENAVNGDALEILQNLTYVMAKQAKPTIPDIETWLDSFEAFDVENFGIDVGNLFADTLTTRSEAKNA